VKAPKLLFVKSGSSVKVLMVPLSDGLAGSQINGLRGGCLVGMARRSADAGVMQTWRGTALRFGGDLVEGRTNGV